MKPGDRYRSTVCATEIVVIRAPQGEVDLRCGGAPMVPLDVGADVRTVDNPNPTYAGGTLLGKRYGDDDLGIEVLCTKEGVGSLSIGEILLTVRQPKPLPSSD